MATSNNWSLDLDDEDDNESNSKPDQQNTPKALRQHLRKLDEENKAMKAKLEEHESKARRGSIETILKDKKLDPRVAAFIPKDVDASDEAVGKWVEEYGDLFSPKGSSHEDDPGGEEDDAFAFERESYKRRDRVEARTSSPDRNTDLLSQVQSAQSAEALEKLVSRFGGGYGRG